jgi:hypothetical protein
MTMTTTIAIMTTVIILVAHAGDADHTSHTTSRSNQSQQLSRHPHFVHR